MADSPISALPQAGAVTGAELLALVQGGITCKATLLQVLAILSTRCVWDRNVFNNSMGGVISNGGLTHTATNSGIGNMVLASRANSTGKRYFEVRMDVVTGAGTPTVGVAQSNASSAQVGQGPVVSTNRNSDWGLLANSGNKYGAGTSTAYGTALAANDILMVAVDLDADLIWWGKNGTWFASGNPAAGTGAAFNTVQDAVYPAITNSAGSKATANFAGPFQYAPPAGFTAWDA
ncbi:SPRY domain-containing protein [Stenotrophomonas sp. VV52]|uniref:SPRY domain-containing protein n=1 Tax=Stenotrophomonas sp. VV52 TaxID=2066958 RepID=UPI000C9E5C69|nr:SPRY domain-containing protein [Stenotrophomonas sp. VV52]